MAKRRSGYVHYKGGEYPHFLRKKRKEDGSRPILLSHEDFILDMERQYDEFIEGKVSSTYLKNSLLEVYTRLTERPIFGLSTRFIDVARIEVAFDHRRMGVAGKFFTMLEAFSVKHGRGIYVESIVNPLLVDMLENRGYTKVAYDNTRLCAMYDIQGLIHA